MKALICHAGKSKLSSEKNFSIIPNKQLTTFYIIETQKCMIFFSIEGCEIHAKFYGFECYVLQINACMSEVISC